MDKAAYVPMVRLTMTKEKELPYTGKNITNPEEAAELARRVLEGADREYLVVLSVGIKGEPVAMEITSIGTLDRALAFPREVFKHAILANAAGIILIHNHPSGDCTPSDEDKVMTGRMEDAGNLLGIPVEDHVIIGDGYFSFREKRMLA